VAIVHIGLGKTATTTLQQKVFPLLQSTGAIDAFNPRPAMLLLSLNRLLKLDNLQIKKFRDIMSEKPRTLISFESLVDWNPDNWERARDENLTLFGSKSTILITIREPRSYLTSVYQQMVAQGYVTSPNQFFLANKYLKQFQGFTRRGHLDYFNQQSFDLSRLVDLYSEKFSLVIVVALPRISEMKFVNEFSNLPPNDLENLSAEFSSASAKMNLSYSNTAMKLTFARERVLATLGLKSKSSHDVDIKALSRLIEINEKGLSKKDAETPRATRRQKKYGALRKLREWRYLMQVVVNRFLPYKKYELPAGVLNESVIAKNDEFYKSVLNAPEGYLRLGRLNGRNRKS
jgi:hypothetical protein